ncbi:MAG: penicillin-binding protein 2 [Actinobacteria bacterium]|nr:penicillin-binding protein 2 [Actinomycetota bacterium]
MNKQITRLAVTGVALIGALIVATTYWQAWAAPDLQDRQDNAIQRVAQFTVKRGRILASDRRTVVAGNEARRVSGKTFYFRRYPQRGLFAHVVGYSNEARSRAGLEQSQNDYLTAANENLGTVLDSTLDRIRGTTVEGNDLVLTLDARAQRVARDVLGGRCGAIVALEPRTGRVLVLVSSPSYDPNVFQGKNGLARVGRIRADCKPANALYNRATSGLYAPGSTFKVVTASAALDGGRYTLESKFDDPGFCVEYGRRVYNYFDQTLPSGYGRVDFLDAMQFSINSVFCNIGKRLGPLAVLDSARRFGFFAKPPLETPEAERRASGLYDRGRLFRPKDPSDVDPGRLAFGQERLLVTPLQMAMVAAAVAAGGTVLEPHVIDRIVSPGGRTVLESEPKALGRAIERSTAADLTTMMKAVVAGGTATAAQIPGVVVAGKTGTAETGVRGVNTTSFIGFAPAGAPRVAIAVILENQRGTGGKTAAPLARPVLQALLGTTSNSVEG